MAAHLTLGKHGEDIAQEHLLDEGYTILHRNWRYKKAEVDLIAMDGDTLVFIEVKTRSYAYFGEPEDSVHFRKQDLLISAASAYMHEHEWAYRFDVIALIKESDQRYHIKHLVDAFTPRVIDEY